MEVNYTYDIVDIAKAFHNFKHLNLNLQELQNRTFDPRSPDYLKSIGVFAAWPILALLIILVLYLLISLFVCCCCSGDKKREGIKVECKVFIFLFGLVCGLSFIAGLYGDWELREAIKRVRSATDDGIDWFDAVRDNVSEVLKVLEVEDDMKGLKDELQKIYTYQLPPDVKSSVKDAIGTCETIESNIKDSSKQIADARKELDQAKIDFIREYIDDYGDKFCIAVLVVLLVLAIIGLVFTFAICSRCLLGCFTVLAVLALILGSLIAAVTMSASVILSDACYEVKPWAKAELNNEQIYNYVVECLDNNIVSVHIDWAKNLVKLSNDQYKTYDSLIEQLKIYYPEMAAELTSKKQPLDNRFQEINVIMAAFEELAHCKRINDDLNDCMSAICTDGVKGVVMILFNTIASSVCFTVLVFSATFALR
ncbi:unnamed protein product [Oppiella nova]|uniref:Protein tweety homolog n=1 Tax=Oppiella nova TaxID=334625 RepID=A0A7R9M3D2_9ACAR|nr:unnamed protein product [Oppiella nova]CAG2169472.1 unnamed protein product [Oppiella nova]